MNLSMDVCGLRAAQMFDNEKMYSGRAVRAAIIRAASGQYSRVKPACLSLSDDRGVVDYSKAFSPFDDKPDDKPEKQSTDFMPFFAGLAIGFAAGRFDDDMK